MKKFTTLLLALMVLIFSSCKKDPVETNEGEKVRVSCTIPLNEGGKSDFTNLMTDGSVNWSEGRERVYVAIHGATPTIIELKSWAEGNPSKLEFEGEAAKDLITDGTEYDIWYFGHSQQLDEPFVELTDGVLTGSIANQSGRLEDLGYCHIAKTTVTAETVNEEVILNLNGTLEHQIAIALLDLNGVSELYGDAIKGTEYTLTYNSDNGKYELVVTEDSDARISVESASGISYVVLLPNEEDESKIRCKKNDQTYAYTFHNGIKSNKVYFKTGTDGTTAEALPWSEYEEENVINGHEYVDLGLPSGLLWATCNVGANNPEDYGNYYAWGETSTKSTYTEDNSLTYGSSKDDISGNPEYDAARANWEGNWRMPTKDEMQELISECTTENTQVNGVSGWKFIGPNGNSIFFPKAGYISDSNNSYAEEVGFYWSSTEFFPIFDGALYAWHLYCDNYVSMHDDGYRRYLGFTVRPVSGGNFVEPVLATISTDEVTEITSSSALCGVKIISDNGFAVTARGVCWSTSENPTTSDNKISYGGSSDISMTITNLEPNTTYYVRAFAINAAGTSYGAQKIFTTLSAGPNANGHEYVDLDLPSGLKWATCNVGASSPEEYGDYFAWGETETKSVYTYDNSLTFEKTPEYLKANGYIDDEGNLTPEHDAAAANWGGSWRMPTKEQMEELVEHCEWEWTQVNGVNGAKVIGPNGSCIFLPAAGFRYASALYDDGGIGYCWSSTPDGADDGTYVVGAEAYNLYFDYGNEYVSWIYLRIYGFTVRPITE